MAGFDLALLLAGIGLLVLMLGGQLVVREGATLAARLGVSPLVIGVVVIGFGTSAPELATGVRAALAGAPALAFGNAVGASLANLLLVLPLAALLRPVCVAGTAIRGEGAAVVVAAALLCALAFLPGAARVGGVAMLLLMAFWLAFSLWRAAAGRAAAAASGLQAREATALMVRHEPVWRTLVLLVMGVAALVTGADLLVTAATRLARQLGIGEDVLGLTLLSFGTCLPELATAILAVRQRQTDIVVGNVLGSCLFNLLVVCGTVQIIAGSSLLGEARSIDGPALLMAAMLVIGLLLIRQRLDRPTAALLMLCYAGWLALRLAG